MAKAKVISKRDTVLKDFSALKEEYSNVDINSVPELLEFKERMGYDDAFVVSLNENEYIYAAIDWEISEDDLFYAFYVINSKDGTSKTYEINPGYKNKKKAAEIIQNFIDSCAHTMYKVALTGSEPGTIVVTCQAEDEEDAVMAAAFHISNTYHPLGCGIGDKEIELGDEENPFTFFYKSIKKLNPIVAPYSTYLITVDTFDAIIEIRAKGTSEEDALRRAADCLINCMYVDEDLDMLEEDGITTKEDFISDLGLIPCSDDGIYINATMVCKV
jgi:hypothetical protein